MRRWLLILLFSFYLLWLPHLSWATGCGLYGTYAVSHVPTAANGALYVESANGAYFQWDVLYGGYATYFYWVYVPQQIYFPHQSPEAWGYGNLTGDPEVLAVIGTTVYGHIDNLPDSPDVTEFSDVYGWLTGYLAPSWYCVTGVVTLHAVCKDSTGTVIFNSVKWTGSVTVYR